MVGRFTVIMLFILLLPILGHSQIGEPLAVTLTFGVEEGEKYEFEITRADPGFDPNWWGIGLGAISTLTIEGDASAVPASYTENAATQFEFASNDSLAMFNYTDFVGERYYSVVGDIIFPISMEFPNGTIVGLYDMVKAYFYNNPVTITELPNLLQLNWTSRWTYLWVINTTTGIIVQHTFIDDSGNTLVYSLQNFILPEPLYSSNINTYSPPNISNSTQVSSDVSSNITIALPFPSLLPFIALLIPLWRRFRKQSISELRDIRFNKMVIK